MRIEHDFLGDVRRPLVPVRVLPIELNGQDGPGAHIGAPPSEPGACHEFQANMKIREIHGTSCLAIAAPRRLKHSEHGSRGLNGHRPSWAAQNHHPAPLAVDAQAASASSAS